MQADVLFKTEKKPMDVQSVFAQLEFNTGDFPGDILTDAIAQQEAIVPLLLEELRSVAADPQIVSNKDQSYIRHIYAMYLLAQFREAAAYPLLVDFVSTPGEIVMDLTGDVVNQDLGRMLASVCHGNIEYIKRLIEDPQVNEWVRSAALDALVELYADGQLEREPIMDYFGELFSFKLERRPSFVWSELVNAACDLYPEELETEIRKAYEEGLVNPGDVEFSEVKMILRKRKERILRETVKYRKGLIGNVIDEINWWACFRKNEEEDNLDWDLQAALEAPHLPAFMPLVRSGPKIGRNDSCPCGSGKKYKKCCLGKDRDLH